MVVGASIGGYGGAYCAQKMNPQHVHRLVIAVGLAVSAYSFIDTELASTRSPDSPLRPAG
jgi:uncharacterized membrane protein YfcA